MKDDLAAIDFPKASECSFLETARVSNLPALPEWITLNRAEKLLRFEYRFKDFYLGISKDGWLCGFRGKLTAGKKCELIILRSPENRTFHVFDARHTTAEELAAALEALSPAAPICPPSGFAPEAEGETNYYGIKLSPQQCPRLI